MLHKLNPVRLAYIRDQVDQHWSLDECSRRPLEGKTALDVGCGAGLLAEPLARLGAAVTAIDAAPELIEAARDACRRRQGLEIDYRAAAVETVEGQFDLVTCLEVIEHVADPQAFVARAGGAAGAGRAADPVDAQRAPAWSKLLTITLAEGFGADPQGHARLRQVHLARADEACCWPNAGLECRDVEGIAWSPTARACTSARILRLNYLVARAGLTLPRNRPCRSAPGARSLPSARRATAGSRGATS